MFKHGIFYNEVPTSVIPTLTVATPTVVIGVAPIHLATDPAPANTPVLCNTYAEYVERFGWSGDIETFTCEEAAYVHFALYNVRPLIVINVKDGDGFKQRGKNRLQGNPFDADGQERRDQSGQGHGLHGGI